MTFPALVPPELWQQVQTMRHEATHRSNITKAKADPNAALLQGMGRIKCLNCGGPMPFESRRHRGEGKGLYRCRRRGCPDAMSFPQPELDWLTVCTVRDMVMDEMWLEDRYNASLETGGELDQEIDRATAAVRELTKTRNGLRTRVAQVVDNPLLRDPYEEELQIIGPQWLAAKEREANLLQQRAQAKQNAAQVRDFSEWLAEHREGSNRWTWPACGGWCHWPLYRSGSGGRTRGTSWPKPRVTSTLRHRWIANSISRPSREKSSMTGP